MFRKENSQNFYSVSEKVVKENEDPFLEIEETFGEGEPSPEKLAEERRTAPEPTAIGNTQIEILKHYFIDKLMANGGSRKCIAVSYKNISDTDIHKATFETVFYNAKGDIVTTLEKSINDFDKNANRLLYIDLPKDTKMDIKSYSIKILKIATTPKSLATGNDKIIIINHKLSVLDMDDYEKEGVPPSASLSIRNISELTFARVIFEAEFFDNEGNIIDTVKHTEVELKSGTNRSILITSSLKEFDIVKGYNIKIIKMTTADIEKIKICRQEKIKTEAGEEVAGIIKNISTVKTNAGLVATYYDSNNEIISTRIFILRDIAPNEIKQFHFLFKPQIGDDIVRTYTLDGVTDIQE